MRLLVTGANGFLGAEIVTRAVARGHDVVAAVRPGARINPRLADASVDVIHHDLRSRGPWLHDVEPVDVVIHAAAAAGGSRGVQLANTVVATERLLEALDASPPAAFVLVSSFSVYDYHALACGAALDEGAALESRPLDRDAYTEAKLLQERLVRRWCESRSVPCVVVRPGAIVGPGKSWGYGAAFTSGRFAFVVAPRSRFRLVSVANCADAVVLAAERRGTGAQTLNIVDDDPPTYAEFFRRCQRAGAPPQTMVPVPWRLLDTIGRVVALVGRTVFDGRLRVPELLDHRRQEARWKPLTYPNAKARDELGWRSAEALETTIGQLVATEWAARG